MIRLLQAMAGAPHGGAETFFVRLALAFERAGQDQRILIRRDSARAAALRVGGIAPIELPFHRWLDLSTLFGFRRAIRDYRPQIVLTWMTRATQLCPSGEFVHVARLGGYYDLRHYRRCQHLIGNTQEICDYLVRSGWPAERAHYLPNFVPEMRSPPVARASLGTPEDVPLILALGRLHENKAFDVLLAAMAFVPRAHLWLAGEGPLRAALETKAAALDIAERVHFLGWREDTAALLAAADMLACPSRQEPLGNVVIEAWSASVPIVAAASAGPAALIRDGETGLLVPIDDSAALAAAIGRLAGDPALRNRLAEAGHAAYAAQFGETTVVARYREFLERVAR